MSIQWLRLWHDMPTDPKWRTIAKASGQRIGDVIAVYLHILVAASNASERGRTHSLSTEDVASALDLETSEVDAIVAAMQVRVLDGDHLKGWEKRQPAREDGSAGRSARWREEQKAKNDLANAARTQANADERKRPLDTDTDKSSSVPKGTDAAASPVEDEKPKTDTSKAELWAAAESVLEAGGCPKAQARTFMGKLVGDYTLPTVQQAVAAAVSAQPADAREYLKATCQRLKGERKDPVTVPSTAAAETAEFLRQQSQRKVVPMPDKVRLMARGAVKVVA